MKTGPELNDNGSSTSNPLGSPMTPSSTASTDVNGTYSSAPLPQPLEMEDFQATLSKPWLHEQSEIPFQVYARPSGSTDAQTHQKTKTFNLVSFYNDNIDRTPTTTPNRSSKKPSPCVLLQKSQNDELQNCRKPLDSSSPWQSSLQCDRVSTSKSPKPRSDEPTSSASATSDFSRTGN